MTLATARLTKRYQITLPSEVRLRLGLRAGDLVYFVVDGDQVALRGVPEGWTARARGLGADLWRKEGGGAAALDREQGSWCETQQLLEQLNAAYGAEPSEEEKVLHEHQRRRRRARC